MLKEGKAQGPEFAIYLPTSVLFPLRAFHGSFLWVR